MDEDPLQKEELSVGNAVELILNQIIHTKAKQGVLRLNAKKELILDLSPSEGSPHAFTLPLEYQIPLIGSFKINCELNVSNRETPQKGFIVYEGHKFSVETQQVKGAKEEIVITQMGPTSPAEQ